MYLPISWYDDHLHSRSIAGDRARRVLGAEDSALQKYLKEWSKKLEEVWDFLFTQLASKTSYELCLVLFSPSFQPSKAKQTNKNENKSFEPSSEFSNVEQLVPPDVFLSTMCHEQSWMLHMNCFIQFSQQLQEVGSIVLFSHIAGEETEAHRS